MFFTCWCSKQRRFKSDTDFRFYTANKSIVPHAFGDHSNCETRWCKFKSNPATYKHKELPYRKDLHGKKLQLALINIFNGSDSTNGVAEKLAPLTNSQRNEALNSVIESKDPKIRFYSGIERNQIDQRVVVNGKCSAPI